MSKGTTVQVTTMDAELEFAIQSNTTGKQLFDQVNKTIGLREVWYFGLQYTDIKGFPSWLTLAKRVLSQDIKKENPLLFKYRVKFYPEDASEELIQEVTQRMFFLQVKEQILTDEIYCSSETAVLLASYALQAKYGDHKPDFSTDTISNERLLPQRVIDQHRFSKEEWDTKIIKWYQEHEGMLKEEAMLEYLKIAQDLEMYGVNYFEIKNKKGTDLFLGVDAMGLNIYKKEDKLNGTIGFPWSEILNVSFKGKRFCIKPIDRKSQDFIFIVPRVRINKKILALCMGNHELYIRRRKPDSIEVQQMKSQAVEEKQSKQVEKDRLNRERLAREDAERRLADLELRLLKESEQHLAAQRELETFQSKISQLESTLEQENVQKNELEEMRLKLEENNQKLEESRNMATEDYQRLLAEKEEITSEIMQKNSEIEVSSTELLNAREEVERLRLERLQLEEKTQELELKAATIHVTEQTYEYDIKEDKEDVMLSSRDSQSTHAGDEPSDETGADLQMMNGVSDLHSEETRETNLQKNKRLQEQLQSLSSELKSSREESKLGEADLIHEMNVREGRDKFKTLKQIRMGNTKKRIDEFEAL